MRVPLLLGLMAWGYPQLGVAQTNPTMADLPAATTPHPQFFVGLGTSAGIYRSFNDFFKSGPSPEVTVGLRLTPRLALEISTSYAQHAETNDYISEPTFYDQTTNTNIHAHVRTETSRRIIGVPLLLRFTPSRVPAKRLHLDLLAGLTVARIAVRDQFAAKNDAQVVFYSFGSDTQNFENYLDGGLSLRYSPSSRIELLANGLGQLSITHPNPYGGNLCGSLSTSLRYNFGNW